MGTLGVSGCLGDPPPDPRSAPLEVVLEGCLLNRESVQAGRHQVAVVGEGTLVVVDPDGADVVELRGAELSPREVDTRVGDYVLLCRPAAGGESQAVLRVDP